jgi:transmembrane sensor
MVQDNHIQESIAEEAAHWWVVLHSDTASATDHREFGEWASRSPERVEAYLQTARLLGALKSPEQRWPSTSAAELIAAARASTSSELLRFPVPGARGFAEGDGDSGDDVPDSRVHVEPVEPRHKRLVMLWAASAAVVIAVSGWWQVAGPQVYETKFNEQRSVVLEDGSRVTLNTASRIEVELKKNHRVVRLAKGEALFEVAHDTSRPFDVEAGSTVVRAVGTEFNIDMRPASTTVTVVEGRVAVVHDASLNGSIPLAFDLSAPTASRPLPASSAANLPAPAGSPRSARSAASSGSHGTAVPEQSNVVVLTAADRLVITPSGTGSPQRLPNPSVVTSWTQHLLAFEKRPLKEVAEEFNRYNRRQLVIQGSELQQQEVTGVFQSNNPDSFLAFLMGIPGVQIERTEQGQQIVVLMRAHEHIGTPH